MSLVPMRVRVAWNALMGRPVMYRIGVSGECVVYTRPPGSRGLITGCTFTAGASWSGRGLV